VRDSILEENREENESKQKKKLDKSESRRSIMSGRIKTINRKSTSMKKHCVFSGDATKTHEDCSGACQNVNKMRSHLKFGERLKKYYGKQLRLEI